MRFLRLFGTKFIVPFAFAAAVIVANPSQMSLQDMSVLVSGIDTTAEDRWLMHVSRAGVGSIHSAEVRFPVDTGVTGAIRKPDGTQSGVGPIAVISEKQVLPETPDEARINRTEKSGRIAAVVPVAPPKDFSAGSILERQSNILRPSFGDDVQMAFVKPRIRGEEMQIAAAFHIRKPAPEPQVSSMIASLVTNTNADVLATAYAPPEADFAQESPFASLLRNEPAARGRFIPPVPENDHAWASNPLPPRVFSNREQKCLAEGIYFEARGEIARGQAAVAQVILNRVRNPSFPNSICGVVYQNRHWRNRCQFSFACDGIRDRITEPHMWQKAKDIAMATTAGKIWLDEVGSSTHYHATYVNPRWARSMKRLTRIGLHIFYRTYGGGWS
ncbi:MAG: cell wall hydrolase [Phyllobacteriaceae bacterium]|nr:cell wall hydrolase [Phyllobacteriaceae bacterium]